MCNLRSSGDTRPVIYLDETWVNQNHSRNHILQNDMDSEGFKVPTGKGGRLIVCQQEQLNLDLYVGQNYFSEVKMMVTTTHR